MIYNLYDNYKKLEWDEFIKSYKDFIYSNAFNDTFYKSRMFVPDLTTVLKELIGGKNRKAIFIERFNIFLQITEDFAVSSKKSNEFADRFYRIMDHLYLSELRVEKKWFKNEIIYVNKFTCSLQGVLKYGEGIIKKYKNDGIIEAIYNNSRLENIFNLKEYIFSKMLNLRDNETKKKRNYISYYMLIKDDLNIDYEAFCEKFKTNNIRKKTLLWIGEHSELEKLNFIIKIGKNKYTLNVKDAVLWNYFVMGAQEVIKYRVTKNGYPDGMSAFSMSELTSQYNQLSFCKNMMPVFLRKKHEAARLPHFKVEWQKADLDLRLAAVDNEKKIIKKI